MSNVHSKHAASTFGVDPQLVRLATPLLAYEWLCSRCNKLYSIVSADADMQAVDMHNHSWTNYVQAAYKGVFEHLQKHHPDQIPQPVGLNLVVDGQVPQGALLAAAAFLFWEVEALWHIDHHNIALPCM